jgi:hypothetical protein
MANEIEIESTRPYNSLKMSRNGSGLMKVSVKEYQSAPGGACNHEGLVICSITITNEQFQHLVKTVNSW